jgi:hypothetical protein
MDSEQTPEPLMSRAERHRREQQAVDEAGGGESEGFELAERELIEHASHGDEHGTSRITHDAGRNEDAAPSRDVYGEGDDEHVPD